MTTPGRHSKPDDVCGKLRKAAEHVRTFNRLVTTDAKIAHRPGR
jgi:hypothetical protein